MLQSQIWWCSAIIVAETCTDFLCDDSYRSSKSWVICRSELRRHCWIPIKWLQYRGKHQNNRVSPICDFTDQGFGWLVEIWAAAIFGRKMLKSMFASVVLATNETRSHSSNETTQKKRGKALWPLEKPYFHRNQPPNEGFSAIIWPIIKCIFLSNGESV